MTAKREAVVETEGAAVDPLLVGELLVVLRAADGPARALIAKLEAADGPKRRVGCSTAKLRQLGNVTEWVRMCRMRIERLSQQLAEGGTP